jgi:hypothetical protein
LALFSEPEFGEAFRLPIRFIFLPKEMLFRKLLQVGSLVKSLTNLSSVKRIDSNDCLIRTVPIKEYTVDSTFQKLTIYSQARLKHIIAGTDGDGMYKLHGDSGYRFKSHVESREPDETFPAFFEKLDNSIRSNAPGR